MIKHHLVGNEGSIRYEGDISVFPYYPGVGGSHHAAKDVVFVCDAAPGIPHMTSNVGPNRKNPNHVLNRGADNYF